MKYFATGKVIPERANICFPQISWDIPDAGRVVVQCDSSQLAILIDLGDLDGIVSAYLQAEHFALIAVGSIGFSLGSGYSVEIVQVTEETGVPHVFGVRPTGIDGVTLGFEHSTRAFERTLTLSNKDIFFRFAILDYIRAIRDPTDCASHCFRAIESIRSAYISDQCKDGWVEMHARLGTSRDEITNKIKVFADPVRHGNWINATPTNSGQRWEMLLLTRNVLLKYLDFHLPLPQDAPAA